MAPDKSLSWAVHVLTLVGKSVMAAMMRRPPQRSPLGGGSPQHGKQKLADSAGFECLMGKVAVIKCCNREHAKKIGKKRNPQGDRTPSDDKNQQAGQMHQYEGDYSKPVHRTDVNSGLRCSAAVKPLLKGQPSVSFHDLYFHWFARAC